MMYDNCMDNNSQIKITKEEQTEILELNAEYQNLLIAFGEISAERFKLKSKLKRLKENEKTLNKTFLEFGNKETIMLERLKRKYGDGQLDIESGIYIKN